MKRFPFVAISLAHKIRFVVLATSLVSLLVALSVMLKGELRDRVEIESSHAETLTRLFGFHAEAALADGDGIAAQAVLDSLRADPSVILAKLTLPGMQRPALYVSSLPGRQQDMISRILAEADRDPDRLAPVPRSIGSMINFMQLPYLEVTQTIHVQGGNVGRIELYFDHSATVELLKRRILSALGVIGLTGFLALLLANRMQKLISRPIADLSQRARAISLTKDFSLRVQVEPASMDETGVLIRAFNAMLEQIEQQDKALREIQGSLERRVKDRTQDLLAAKNAAERAEAQMADALSLTRATLESTENGILVIDNQRTITTFNTRFTQMWNIPDELVYARDDKALLGHVLNQLSDPEGFLAKVQELYDAPEAISNDTVHFTDGRVFERYSQPQRIKNTVVGRVWSFLDVTERRTAEARLRIMSLAVEQSPNGIVLTDLSGRIQFANQAFAETSGYARHELLGHLLRRLQSRILPARDEEELERYAELWETLRQGRTWQGEFICYRKDGSSYFESTLATPVRQPDGQISHYLYIKEDISDMKKLMHELEQARVAADASNQAKSDFLANMSHEIRTPMNAIIGMTDLCLNTDVSPRQKNYLTKIKGASDALLRIINDILDFSKIEAGKLAMEMAAFELDDVLTHLAGLLAKRVEEQGCELIYDIDPNALTAPLVGDAFRLGQVLINLLGNAVKFSPAGNITLAVRITKRQQEWLEVRFTVSDEGIGLTHDQMGRIFTAFTQADSSTTRRFGGTGLGLAISKRLVEMMHGHIWVESQYGKGSQFHFTARFKAVSNAGQIGPAELAKRFKPFAHRAVLLVENNPATAKILQQLVAQLGLKCELHATGSEAVAAASHVHDAPYLACIVNWKLPDMDGMETLKSLSIHDQGSDRPVRLLLGAFSGNPMPEDYQAFIDDILVKPVSILPLYNKLAIRLGLPVLEGHASSSTSVLQNIDMSAYRDADILIVEDVEINQEVLLDLLHHAGLRARVASNGEEALQAVALKRPDIILMDCQMPIMDGYEATRRLRQTPECQDLPIIAITADALNSDQARSIAAGMNAHVAKPINAVDLFNKLRQFLKPNSGVSEQDAAVSPSSSDSCAALPFSLPGFDIKLGMSQVGSAELYVKLLHKFHDHQVRVFEQEFDAALADNNIESAARLAHSLKGVARTVGACVLGEQAFNLEKACKEHSHTLITLARTSVLKELALVDDSLQQAHEFLESTPARQEDPDLPLGDTKQSLLRLRELLDSRDTEAGEYVRQVSRQFADTPIADLANRLEHAIDRYDFPGASRLLDQLINARTQT